MAGPFRRQQKLLEFGKMLMLDPKMVLLDEPFAGVHPDVWLDVPEHSAVEGGEEGSDSGQS